MIQTHVRRITHQGSPARALSQMLEDEGVCVDLRCSSAYDQRESTRQAYLTPAAPVADGFLVDRGRR